MTKETSEVFSVGKLKKPAKNKWKLLIEKGLKTKSYPSRDRIFASSAGHCERQTAGLMMMRDEFESKISASSKFYFKIGSAVEEVVENAFKSQEVFVTSEYRIEAPYDWLPLSGRIDFVIKDPENKDLVLVELKTCGKLPTSPKPYHLNQLMTYLTVTGKKRGLLWYVSRHVSDWSGTVLQEVFEIEASYSDKIPIANRLAMGTVYYEKNLLPPIPTEMKKYKCGFCPLVPFCWDDEPMKFSGPVATTEQQLEIAKTGILQDRTLQILEDQTRLAKDFDKQFLW